MDEEFEFVDCGTLSIQYSITGEATVSFTVVSTHGEPVGSYSEMDFGGVNFRGYVTNLVTRQLEGTAAYEHSFQIVAVGN